MEQGGGVIAAVVISLVGQYIAKQMVKIDYVVMNKILFIREVTVIAWLVHPISLYGNKYCRIGR